MGAAPSLGERGLLARPEERRKHGRELASYARVLSWAEENLLILNPSPFAEALRENDIGGGEHKLIFDEESQRYIKVTKLDYFGYNGTNGGEYLQRWALANRVVGDDVAFEGFVKLPGEEDYRPVISQPFVEGRDATSDEVEDVLDEKGFHPMEEAIDWITTNNIITRPNGQKIAIDIQDGTPGETRRRRGRAGEGAGECGDRDDRGRNR